MTPAIIAASSAALIAIAAGTRRAARRHKAFADSLKPGKHRTP
jgi:hypothetical protein